MLATHQPMPRIYALSPVMVGDFEGRASEYGTGKARIYMLVPTLPSLQKKCKTADFKFDRLTRWALYSKEFKTHETRADVFGGDA